MIVRLKLKASRLKNVAGLFKGISDPYASVVLLYKNQPMGPLQRLELGNTEVVKNNLSPDWTTTFQFDYQPTQRPILEISIHDRVTKSKDICMGSATLPVQEVLDSKGSIKSKRISLGGMIIVRLETVSEADQGSVVRLAVSIQEVGNKIRFRTNQRPYFYQISRKQLHPNGTEWCVVHRSEQVKEEEEKDSNQIQWQEKEIDGSVLCRNDWNAPLLFEIFRYERNGRHGLVGRCETTIHGMGAATANNGGFTLCLEDKQIGKIFFRMDGPFQSTDDDESLSNDSPHISPPQSAISTPLEEPDDFTRSRRIHGPTEDFADFMKAGYELRLKIAIDFTGSNGDPRKPGTLHHLNADGSKNDYEKAIHAISGAILPYVPNQKVAVWGFGAKYGGKLFNCFQCGPKAESDGVVGVLEAYRLTFKSGLVMSGPTDITEVINTASEFARSSENEGKLAGKKVFTILLILTDGSVSNAEVTRDCLQQVNDAPISVILVGIGNADFSAMKSMNDNGNMCRMPFHFVDFNSCNEDLSILTRVALEEILSHLSFHFTRDTD